MLLSLSLALHTPAALAADPAGLDPAAMYTSPAPDGASMPGSSSGSSKSSSKSSNSSSSSKNNKSSSSSKNNSKNKSSSSTDANGDKFFKTFRVAGFKVKPYVAPGGGVVISGTSLAATAGVDGGFKYTHKKWTGDLYGGVAGAFGGSTTSSYDVHIGDDTGARFKLWGATLGVEGAYNGYVFSNGSTVAPAATGSLPLKVLVGPKKYHVAVGIAPSITSDPSRHVDWAKYKAIGFGDEFSWMVVGAINIKSVAIKVGFTQQTLGDNGKPVITNTPSISVGIGDSLNFSTSGN